MALIAYRGRENIFGLSFKPRPDLGKCCAFHNPVEVSGLEPPASTLRRCRSCPPDLVLYARFPGGGFPIPSGSLRATPLSLSIRSRKVTASGRPPAIAAPVRRDESVKVLNVVASGRTNFDDRQLAPRHKTFNRRPGHAEVLGGGTDWQQAPASRLWLERFFLPSAVPAPLRLKMTAAETTFLRFASIK